MGTQLRSTLKNPATKKANVLDVVRSRTVDFCDGESVAYKHKNGACSFLYRFECCVKVYVHIHTLLTGSRLRRAICIAISRLVEEPLLHIQSTRIY